MDFNFEDEGNNVEKTEENSYIYIDRDNTTNLAITATVSIPSEDARDKAGYFAV